MDQRGADIAAISKVATAEPAEEGGNEEICILREETIMPWPFSNRERGWPGVGFETRFRVPNNKGWWVLFGGGCGGGVVLVCVDGGEAFEPGRGWAGVAHRRVPVRAGVVGG